MPLVVNAAEILQIVGSDNVLIGDQNRDLSIKLYCLDVKKSDQEIASDLLKRNFPRGTKVKIMPYGFFQDKLIAKVYRLNDHIEMSELLISNNLASATCDD